MARLCLTVLSAALAASAIGCAHCQTCDDFPVPCTGPNCGHAGHGSYAPPVFGAGPVVMPAGMPVPVPDMGPYLPPSQAGAPTPPPPVSDTRVGENPDPAPADAPGISTPPEIESQPTPPAPSTPSPSLPGFPS